MVRHYLLLQPKKLECLAMDKLAAWNASQAKNIMTPISELYQHDATKAEAAFSRQIEIIRNYLERGTPKMFHDTLSSTTIEELFRLLKKTKRSLEGISDIQINIIERMVETVFTENLTTLSLCFYQFTMFRDSLRNKSHMLSGLIHLGLNFDASAETRDDTETTIIELLEQLHNLKYVTIKYICTDNILRCLVRNCTSIEELNVYSSKEINDNSVDLLAQLHYLRCINLDKTSIRQRGIETLLLSCKHIEQLVIPLTSDNTDSMPYILEQIEKSDQNVPKTFDIKTYRNNGHMDTLEDLQLAFRMCPLIQNLSVQMHSTRRSNIMSIIDLKYLRKLTLEAYAFYQDQVKAALQVIGNQLVELHLLRVRQINLNALINISKMCPNLESLCLEDCTYIAPSLSLFSPQNTKVLKIPLFTNLKKLTLDMKDSFNFSLSWPSSWWHEPAFFLLSNCLNLEIVKCSIKFWLPEDVILKVLDRNPLIYLKEFKIVQSYKTPQTMTPLVIERIIQNCISCPEVIQVLAP